MRLERYKLLERVWQLGCPVRRCSKPLQSEASDSGFSLSLENHVTLSYDRGISGEIKGDTLGKPDRMLGRVKIANKGLIERFIRICMYPQERDICCPYKQYVEGLDEISYGGSSPPGALYYANPHGVSARRMLHGIFRDNVEVIKRDVALNVSSYISSQASRASTQRDGA